MCKKSKISDELKWRSQCGYFWKKGKKLEDGICCAAPSAHYEDTPCRFMGDCFWMQEYRKEIEKDR